MDGIYCRLVRQRAGMRLRRIEQIQEPRSLPSIESVHITTPVTAIEVGASKYRRGCENFVAYINICALIKKKRCLN